ncbi:TerD family protein [Pseudonocardia sp. N23]|uniref:TerD family protein n=1 Tax=Pseudonocardia sp. N23 TaxID=1987376 RepID=UPI000BFE090D|nr:TerD family protein [Pseudonocardia sp. N23]GAY11676.1 tellurium resistance protein TerD [Pseudonocardia sp. N23]
MSVNMTKGQKVSLAKRGGGSLTVVRMGLGWDAVKKKGLFGGMKSQTIDLDASALLFDGAGRLVDAVWFRQLQSRDGSVRHTGDNLTGDGDGDDESVVVDLTRLSPGTTQIVFTVNSFTGQDFSQIENAFCRLVDETTGEELARYDLSGSGRHNAQIMAKVSRAGSGEWTMTAIGAVASGRTVQDLVPATAAHL